MSEEEKESITDENIQKESITDENIQKAVYDWYLRNESALSKYGDIKDWDTSNVTDMSLLFMELEQFNDDISNWNVSKVTDMNSMFWKATNFNQPLGNWERKNSKTGKVISTLGKVKDMEHMFYKAEAFNQDLKSWNINEVIFPKLNNSQNTDNKFKLEFHIFPKATIMNKDNYPLLGDAKADYDTQILFKGIRNNGYADKNPNTTNKNKQTRQQALEIILQKANLQSKRGGKKRKTIKKRTKKLKKLKKTKKTKN